MYVVAVCGILVVSSCMFARGVRYITFGCKRKWYIYIYICVCVCVCVRYSIGFLSSPTGCHSSPSQIFKLLKLAYSMCRVFFAGMSRARTTIVSCLICAMALGYMIKNICLICKWFPLHVKICLHACKNQLAMGPK